MANKRSRNYILSKGRTSPLRNKNHITSNPDNRIDQDFSGYPHGHADNAIITPSTATEMKIADVENKDGEKRIKQPDEKIQEALSDGSASAFDATESVAE